MCSLVECVDSQRERMHCCTAFKKYSKVRQGRRERIVFSGTAFVLCKYSFIGKMNFKKAPRAREDLTTLS